MSYRCGIYGIPNIENGPPRITCDACGFRLEINPRKAPPKWLFDNRAAPKWTLIRKEDPECAALVKRLDFCPKCTLETLLEERDAARACARVLAHAYETDNRPPDQAVRAAMMYPTIPPRNR